MYFDDRHSAGNLFCGLLCAYLLTGAAPLAAAQSGTALEEVVVTASKRSQSLQDVPISVTAFSDQTIQAAGISNASDLAVLTPALTITVNTQPFTAAFRIRGVGTSQTDIALEPSVGLFVDDVYLARSGLGMADLTDIQRIEVLHGPQGTLYGKNTNAGAVSIITKRPNLEAFEGYVETNLGNYDLTRLTVSSSGPLTEGLGYRVSGSVHQRDGYFDNSAGEDFNAANDWNIIAKLLYQPTDSLSFLLNTSLVDRDLRCCAADVVQSDEVNAALAARGLATDDNDPFDYNVAVDVDNAFRNEARSASLVIDFNGDWGSVKSITAWNSAQGHSTDDVDRSELDVMSRVNAVSEGDGLSQEVRFTSPTSDVYEYQLGAFYYQSQTNGGDGTPYVFIGEDFISQAKQQPDFLAAIPGGLPVEVIVQPGDNISADVTLETRSAAIFGQSTWHINDRWRLTGGLRWTDEEKDADLHVSVNSTAPSAALFGLSFLTQVTTPIDDEFSRSTSDLNWLVSSSYDLFEDAMVFASVGTGSKSGGFNTVNGTADEREFEDESTLSYELGIKSTFLDSRLRLNAAAFLTQIDDYQFQVQLETGVGTLVSNQAEVEVSGFELDVLALPLPNLTLQAGLLYMHSYEITDGPAEGSAIPFTAEYSGNLAATFVLPVADGGLYLRSDYSYMDDHLTNSPADVRAQDTQSRSVLNARLGWRNTHWNVAVWGKNLTQDEYAGLTAATLPMTGMDAYFLAPPRTYGATLRYDF